MCRCCWCVDVALDLDLFREKLLLLKQMLLAREEMSKEGEFGYCVTCGEEIAEARLFNLPSVTSCIECARQK